MNNDSIIFPANINNYPKKEIENWINHITSKANEFPQEKNVASCFIFSLQEKENKSVFLNWNTEKNYNELFGNTLMIHIKELIEFESDSIPDQILEKL